MSKENPYIQFPLCALAYGKTVNERLNAILDYGVADAGAKLWGKVGPELQRIQKSLWGRCRNLPKGFNGENPLHCAALYRAHNLHIECSDMEYLVELYERLRKYVHKFEHRYGRDLLVRIKQQWLFKARDHQGLTYREFAVLCGIYSCIGDKPAARVTQPRIRRCALGYRTAPIMDAELPSRADGARPLTERQLRDTIARLHRNNFFARCTYGRRMTYYSIRGLDEQLRNRVMEQHTYPSTHRARQAAKDQAMTAAIKRAQAAQAP
jgi:hypothetical protein